MLDQTVWLAPRATAYVVLCEQCAADHGYLGAQVSGRLDLEQASAAVTCVRGHAIAVVRADHDPIGVRFH